jgi:hypothetical protein
VLVFQSREGNRLGAKETYQNQRGLLGFGHLVVPMGAMIEKGSLPAIPLSDYDDVLVAPETRAASSEDLPERSH